MSLTATFPDFHNHQGNRMAISNRIVALVALLGASAAAYWYWSPYLQMRSIRAAAISGDAEALNSRVDYPRLRESLKSQLSAIMAESLQKAGSDESAAGKAGAALGTLLGGAMLDRMIEAAISPDAIRRSMQSGRMTAPDQVGEPVPNASETKWTIKRVGADRVIAYASDNAADRGPGFVFDRSGFASWRLTEVRLPDRRKK